MRLRDLGFDKPIGMFGIWLTKSLGVESYLPIKSRKAADLGTTTTTELQNDSSIPWSNVEILGRRRCSEQRAETEQVFQGHGACFMLGSIRVVSPPTQWATNLSSGQGRVPLPVYPAFHLGGKPGHASLREQFNKDPRIPSHERMGWLSRGSGEGRKNMLAAESETDSQTCQGKNGEYSADLEPACRSV